MDDSLSDTQQENKMSVNELRLKEIGAELNISKEAKNFRFSIINDGCDYSIIHLNRSQAHLLMLYLQEHLGYVSISKDRLND